MYKFEAIDNKKTIKKCLKDMILYKHNKAHPQENMNQIFNKTKYQKGKKRSWIFIILFSNKRVCKLFTRHSRQWVQWCSINTFCDMCRNFLSLPLQKLLNLSPLGLLNIEQIVNLNFISNLFLKGYAIWTQTFCYL